MGIDSIPMLGVHNCAGMQRVCLHKERDNIRHVFPSVISTGLEVVDGKLCYRSIQYGPRMSLLDRGHALAAVLYVFEVGIMKDREGIGRIKTRTSWNR